MDKEKFKRMNRQIKPSASLMENTKERMMAEVQKNNRENGGIQFMKNFTRKFSTAVAAVFLVFVVSVNASSVIAAEVKDIPVLGKIASIFIIKNYTEKDNDKEITVNEPVIVENKYVESKDINEKVQAGIDEYVKGAKERVAEYKKAFLETGGTEKEFSEKEIKISVDYKVKTENDKYLSFIVQGFENWVSFYAEYNYYNYDMETGKELSLKDMLGDDYIEKANESILKQMKEREKEEGLEIYFEKGEPGGFETITDETHFYINEKGNPVVVFEKYEIAPGAYGQQEFEIVK